MFNLCCNPTHLETSLNMEFKLYKLVLLSILATQAYAVNQATRVAAKNDKILDFIKCLEATGQRYKWYADANGDMIVAPEQGDFEPKGKDEGLLLCIERYGKDVPIAVQHITNAEGAGKWEDVSSEHAAKVVEEGVTGLEHVETVSKKRAAANEVAYDMFLNQLTGDNPPSKCKDEEHKIFAYNHCCSYASQWKQFQAENTSSRNIIVTTSPHHDFRKKSIGDTSGGDDRTNYVVFSNAITTCACRNIYSHSA